jgi:hypothetical protein
VLVHKKMDAEIRSVGDTSGLTLLLGRAGRCTGANRQSPETAERFRTVETALEPMVAEVQRSGSARGFVAVYSTMALLKLRLGELDHGLQRGLNRAKAFGRHETPQ